MLFLYFFGVVLIRGWGGGGILVFFKCWNKVFGWLFKIIDGYVVVVVLIYVYLVILIFK